MGGGGNNQGDRRNHDRDRNYDWTLYPNHFFSIVKQKVYFYFFKRPECYNQEVLSHSFICLPLPYMEGIALICNIDLYCGRTIFNGHR